MPLATYNIVVCDRLIQPKQRNNFEILLIFEPNFKSEFGAVIQI